MITDTLPPADLPKASAAQRLKTWLKRGDAPLARQLYAGIRYLINPEIPVVPLLHRGLYNTYLHGTALLAGLARVLWWTPLFKSRLDNHPRDLYLYSGMPQVLGPLRIQMGDHCRLSGITTLSGRSHGQQQPQLIIGHNVGISWQTTLAVGRRMILGDNVRIGGRCLLAGYAGHPLDARARAAGEADREEQVRDIVLENDVWLASGVTVCAGVRIGHGTVVASGSVVTRDLPPMVLAAGVPARVIRPLQECTP